MTPSSKVIGVMTFRTNEGGICSFLINVTGRLYIYNKIMKMVSIYKIPIYYPHHRSLKLNDKAILL